MFIFLLIGTGLAHLFKDNTKVLQSNALELDDLISKNQPLFLMLYAPWCGHCKNLIPTIDALAEDMDFQFVAIDCVEHTEAKLRFQVKGYPTLYLIRDQKVFQYKGMRTKEAIGEFIRTADLPDGQDVPPFVSKSSNFFITIINNIYVLITVIVLLIGTAVVGIICIKDKIFQKNVIVLEREVNKEETINQEENINQEDKKNQ